MANITFRGSSTTPPIPASTTGKGSNLTNDEVDGNFRSLNDGKVDLAGSYSDPGWINSLAESKVLPSQTGNSGKYLTTNGTSSSWASVTLPSGQTSGSSVSGYLQYAGNTKTAGQLDGGTTAPSNTTRLNYDGNFYATNFYGNGANLTSLSASNLSDGTISSSILGNSSLFLGTTSIALNRASSALSLTGVSIDGNAGSASKTVVSDTRAVTTTPETIDQGVVFDFKANTSNALSDGGTYHGLMTFRQYGTTTDWSGGLSHQLGFTDNGNLWHRSGSSTTWGTWYKIYATDDSTTTNTANKLVLRDASGNFAAGDITATNFNTLSDIALKDNISPITNGLDILEKLNPVSFNWKKTGNLSHGLIAQEIEKILPELVNTDIVDGVSQKSVNYIGLIALLINAVKDLDKKLSNK